MGPMAAKGQLEAMPQSPQLIRDMDESVRNAKDEQGGELLEVKVTRETRHVRDRLA